MTAKYRDFLLRLGWAAARERKHELARTFMQEVEELLRQESTRSGKRLPSLTADELLRIGNAYLFAADADAEVNEREAERGWRDALRVYEQVDLAKTPNALVAIHRGWAHIQLKEYRAAHTLLASLDLSRFEEGWRPYLKLDLACAKVRLGKAEGGDTKRRLWEEALRVLEEIEPGYWWEKHIIGDDDIQLLFKDDVLRLRLEDLIRRKGIISKGDPYGIQP